MAVDIDSLYRSHGPMVLRRCRRLLREEAKAVDAMHDVFVEVLRRKDSLDARSPAGLLLTTATHICLNRLRSVRRKPEDPEDEMLFSIAGLGDQPDAESRTLAGRILDRLFAGQPDSTRLIAVLHYVDRLTLEEVAAEVGLSVSGVRKRLRTLKARLPAVTGGGLMSAAKDRVPDWLLERLAAGELPAEQARELRERLARRGEEGRLSDLATSNTEILAALPPARVVAEIERRAVQRPVAARRVRPFLALSLAATCAAGLVGLWVVRAPHGGGQPPGPQVERPESIVIKGLKPSLRIHRKTAAGAELLAPGARVRKGDTLQLGYVAAGQRFGVVASIDGRGTITLHLPESAGPAAALQPDGERALSHAFELDDSPGFERFVFVTSTSPFATADVASALVRGRALPPSLATFELTLQKETP